MSYLVLARKYRPTTFADVAGQEVVTRTLRGAISEGRVGHAYLFFGPRGTGKTTSARLFAKALNCEKGPIEEPCGVCERCLSYDAGTEPDLIEIDAASNTGVDHVRSLRDQASYVPLKARFKVFLIDEVHMLSKAAFNALLKTLEEPPAHVKFLFATTELHKVPDTVVSRCQVLRLSPLSESQIVARLDEVFELEGVEAEPGVSAEIARRARGGMRDALSLADQLLALVGRTPKVVDTARLAGEGSTEAIEAVLDSILASDKVALLKGLPGREGDEPAFLDAVLGYLRSALLLRLIGEDAPMVASSASPEAKAAMAERASKFGADRLELVMQELLHARERMGPIHMRAHARLILEATLLDLCRPEATMPVDVLMQRLEALEGRLAAGGSASTPPSARPLTTPVQASAPTPAARQPQPQPQAQAQAQAQAAPQQRPPQPGAGQPYVP
ncbi:MAG: DNA polymerase-3 subunit gamma/tau, partial [Paracoccaceae bacterium]